MTIRNLFGRLTHVIINNKEMLIFPYQNEIENLIMDLGGNIEDLYFGKIYISPGIYIKHSSEYEAWIIESD